MILVHICLENSSANYFFWLNSFTVNCLNFIRYVWVLGAGKDKDLKYDSARDQYVGQCDAGIEHIKNNYLYLNPNFIFHTLVRML